MNTAGNKMTNTDFFAGLESDQIGSATGGPDNIIEQVKAGASHWVVPKEFGPKTFEETCPKCRGTGKFRTWNGRTLGECFACKGAGKHTFKSSPEARAAGRSRAAVKSAQKQAEKASWREAHKAELTWLNNQFERQTALAHQGKQSWAFPISLSESLAQFGTLTDGQLGAIRKCMAKDDERKAQRAVDAQARQNAAPSIDVSKLEAAFAAARSAAAEDGEGIKWLKFRAGTFLFSDAPARGQWPAAIFVKEGETKLGRIVGGKFLRSFACDDATEQRIAETAADPAGAAKAFGLRTGSCSCCGRELTNEDSRKLGIGPICAAKWGL